MTDTFTLTAPTNSQSTQGALSSQYTNWLTGEVTSNAEWIAYTWWVSQGSNSSDVAKAQEIQAALGNGDFSLSDLFNVANGKTSNTGDIAGDPDPKVIVAGVTLDLAELNLLSGEQTTEWTAGSGKNTVYHEREYLTEFASGDAPPGWGQEPPANDPPTAEAIVVNATETLSVWEDPNVPGYEHEIQNTDPDNLTVDLILDANAADPDGDVLHIVGNSVTLQGGGDLPSYITVVGDTIIIDQNSRELDYLKAASDDPDHSLTVTLEYQITDGVNSPITNTVTINIAGTADEYQTSGSGSNSVTYTGNSNNTGEVLTVNAATLPGDGFDFTYTSGTITVTETGLAGNEKSVISDADPDDWGDSLQVGKVGSSIVVTDSAALVDGALDDGQVNYNANNNSIGTGDTVTVTLDYNYDYWYLA